MERKSYNVILRAFRTVLPLAILICVLSFTSSHESFGDENHTNRCNTALRALSTVSLDVTKTSVKTVAFPMFILGKTVWNKIVARPPDERLRRKWNRTDLMAAILYFGSLVGTGSTPMDWIVQNIGTPHDQVMAGKDYFETSQEGLVVGVDSSGGHENGPLISGKNRANDTDVFHINTSNPFDMLEELRRISKENGKPLKRAVILVHGRPGGLFFNDELESLGEPWVEKSKARLQTMSQDLFAPDAEVVLISCNLAQGTLFDPNKGERFLKTLFEPILLQGGTVYASNRTVYPNEQVVPKLDWFFVRDTAHLVSGAIDAYHYVNSDWKSKTDRTRIIRIEETK